MNELFTALLHAQARGVRSTALQPLQWVLFILILAFVGMVLGNAPLWICVLLACLVVIILILVIIAYIYFMVKNPDALRSEKFVLTKMAFEQGLLGDDIRGLIDEERTLEAPVKTIEVRREEP